MGTFLELPVGLTCGFDAFALPKFHDDFARQSIVIEEDGPAGAQFACRRQGRASAFCATDFSNQFDCARHL